MPCVLARITDAGAVIPAPYDFKNSCRHPPAVTLGLWRRTLASPAARRPASARTQQGKRAGSRSKNPLRAGSSRPPTCNRKRASEPSDTGSTQASTRTVSVRRHLTHTITPTSGCRARARSTASTGFGRRAGRWMSCRYVDLPEKPGTPPFAQPRSRSPWCVTRVRIEQREGCQGKQGRDPSRARQLRLKPHQLSAPCYRACLTWWLLPTAVGRNRARSVVLPATLTDEHREPCALFTGSRDRR